uniref:Ig-like domain-containing protein n=1 Tax=Tetranychus urticae TaxID=32264 RepID=T1KF45_TETUR
MATASKLFQGYKKSLPTYSSPSSTSSSSVCNDGEWGIRSLIVPELVENGTTESIVLDCIYCLNEGEDHRIVVKWFLNDDPQPIYQWIPERHSRHASKRLSGRINLNYSIDSANPLTQYRAINIIKPTTDLSGDYSCVVMSPDNGDSKKAKMIVYGND